MKRVLVLSAVLAIFSAAAPAMAFSFDDWEKNADPQGTLTFDCAEVSRCGAGSRITVATAEDGPLPTVEEYQDLHRRLARERRAAIGGPVAIGPAKRRSVRGFDVVEIEREAELGPNATHYVVNAILHRAGKRYQIICSATNEGMARRNFEGALNETIAYVTRGER